MSETVKSVSFTIAAQGVPASPFMKSNRWMRALMILQTKRAFPHRVDLSRVFKRLTSASRAEFREKRLSQKEKNRPSKGYRKWP